MLVAYGLRLTQPSSSGNQDLSSQQTHPSSAKRGSLSPADKAAPSKSSSPLLSRKTQVPPQSDPPTNSSSPTPSPVSPSLQISTFEEILQKKNDNDPRLDTLLKDLTPQTKHYLFQKYKTLAPEKRSERGLIVFLTGRKIQNNDDLDFLEEVLGEPECLSLSDCTRSEEIQPHHQGTIATTLAYPQILALKMLAAFVNSSSTLTPSQTSEKLSKKAKDLLQRAKNSKVLLIQDMARTLEESHL